MSSNKPSQNGKGLSEHTGAPVKPLRKVILLSPYRDKTTTEPSVPTGEAILMEFSKLNLLDAIDEKTTDLAIDLTLPKDPDESMLPYTDLTPMLVRFRNLTSLKITNMGRSYQTYLWQVIWLNPGLESLTLAMASQDVSELITWRDIHEGREHADRRPSTEQLVQGKKRASVKRKMSIKKLSLTYFVVDDALLDWFYPFKLEYLEFRMCRDADFYLPVGLTNMVSVRVESDDGTSRLITTDCPGRIEIGPTYAPIRESMRVDL